MFRGEDHRGKSKREDNCIYNYGKDLSSMCILQMARVNDHAMQVWDVSLQVRTAPLFSTSSSLSHSFLDKKCVSSVLCGYHNPFIV